MEIPFGNTILDDKKEIFIGREKQIQDFWEIYYQLCERKDTWKVTVLNYCGPGGIGKTCLLNHLYREVRNSNVDTNEKIPTAILGVNSGERSLDTLISLAMGLHNSCGFSFPLFEAALGIGYRMNLQVDANYKSLEERSPIFSAILDITSGIESALIYGIIIRCIDKGMKHIVEYVERQKIKLQSWVNVTPMELERLLPSIFVEDLIMNTNQHLFPTVIFLDKYENLRVGVTGIDVADFQIEWLKKEIIAAVPNIIWVFTGREKIYWQNSNKDWNESIFNIELDFFSLVDVEKYFEDFEFEHCVIKEIYDITKGLPLYLYLCKEILLLQKEKGNIQLDFLRGKQERILHTYIENLDEIQKQILFVLSCLGEWDDALIAHTLMSLGIANYNNEYAVIMKKSYSNVQDDRYILHQVIQEKIFQYCEKDFVERVLMSLRNQVDIDKYTWKYPAWVRCTVKIVKNSDDLNHVLREDLHLLIDFMEGKNINYFEKCFKEVDYAICEKLRKCEWYLLLEFGHVRNIISLGYYVTAKKEINAMLRLLKDRGTSDKLYIMLQELKAQILDNQNRFLPAYNIRKMIVKEAVFIPDEAVQIACLHNLVTSCIHLHYFDEAQKGANHVLEFRKERLDTKSEREDYIRALILQTEILMEKYNAGAGYKYIHDALENQKKCFEAAEALLGKNDYIIAQCSQRLASIYMELRDWKESIRYNKNAANIFIQLNGGRNKITDDIERGIAIAYLELGKTQEGINILNELERLSADYKEGSEITKYRNVLEQCILLSKQKRYQESYDILSDTIPRCKEELGANHLTTLKLIYEQAIECMKLCKYEEALEYLTNVKSKLRYYNGEARYGMLVDLLIVDCREGISRSR